MTRSVRAGHASSGSPRRLRIRRACELAILLVWALAAGTAPARGGGGDRSEEHAASPAGVPLEFDSEIVRLLVRGDSLEVEGQYRFWCRPFAPQAMTLFYPYPEDSLLGEARTTRLECRVPGEPWQRVAMTEAPGNRGSIWTVPLSPGDTLEVRAVYRQALRAPYARYIVTTAREWTHPLRHARFEITLPAAARNVRFSYPFEARRTSAGQTFYLYQETDFWPDRDIIVEWAP